MILSFFLSFLSPCEGTFTHWWKGGRKNATKATNTRHASTWIGKLFIYDHINHRSMLDKMHHRDAVSAVYLVSYFFLLLVDQNHSTLDQLDCINLSILFALLQGTTLMIRSVDLYIDHTFVRTIWMPRSRRTSSSRTRKLLFPSSMSIRDRRPDEERENNLLIIFHTKTNHQQVTYITRKSNFSWIYETH